VVGADKTGHLVCMTEPGPPPAAKKKTQIVVVGGGAGGLELAAKLGKHFGRRDYDIILLEKNRTHVWKPLLHEVATGVLDASLDEVGYRAHGYRWGYRFFWGSLSGIDRQKRQVIVAPLVDEDGTEVVGEHRIRYDYLVLAVGSVTNDFGTLGARGASGPGRRGADRRSGDRGHGGRDQDQGRRSAPLRAQGLGRRREGAGLHEEHRRARHDPARQSARRAADAADDAGRPHLRDRRLRLLHPAGR
jgi:NADPH-dependent 2,4-dienoyl-CoA reductase/sulfur reductase-like enzyme